MIVELTSFERDSVIEKLRKIKEENPDFTVIDVGGSANGWSKGVANALTDKFKPTDSGDVEFFEIDFVDRTTWAAILERVEKYGKFSFSICSHVLEDLESFLPAVELLEQISDSGVVMVPSKHVELSNVESDKYKGYIHHRWIFDAEDGARLVGFPKINLIESLDASRVSSTDPGKYELRAWWSDKIDVERANDGYLGPTGEHVKDMYEKRLLEL
jgi:hypothetical protein